MKIEDQDPLVSCVHSCKVFRAKSYDVVYQKYNDHVKHDHGKPGHVRELGPNE